MVIIEYLAHYFHLNINYINYKGFFRLKNDRFVPLEFIRYKYFRKNVLFE